MAKIQTDKRDFLKFTTLGILGLALGSGMVFSPYILKAEDRLRPPGAVPEKEFLALCIKCGQCLQVCPYHSIKLSDMAMGHGLGTPYIDASVRGCYACDAVPCVLACPSGALDHHTERPSDIHMGIAVLEFADTCLAMTNTPLPDNYNKKFTDFTSSVRNVTEMELEVSAKMDEYLPENGEAKQCTLCADMCPIPSPMTAIMMVTNDNGGHYPEIYDGCVGCGVCQEVCPTSIPSIVVKPRMTYDEYYNKA